MKKVKIISVIVIAVICILLLSSRLSGPYIDGVYEGSSKAIYVQENYWGHTKITVVNGYITKVEFQVIDSTKKEVFDNKYERYFKGNDEYVNQCRNDWKGVQSYPQKLIKYQELKNVDAITGATWSYNMFKYSATEALKKARKN